MSEYADLEIGLNRREAGVYAVEFRFSQPKSETDVRREAEARIDAEALRQIAFDAEAYSQQLTQSFFADPTLRTAFGEACATAQALDTPLRMRLSIASGAPELHGLHWEMLRHPLDGSLLSTSERVLFSRYLSSMDWRPVHLRSREALRALVMVASPSNLAEYQLAPLDREGEFERAANGLGDVEICRLPAQNSQQPATINALIEAIRGNAFDIVYLACHGSLAKGEAWLWLEGEDGKVQRASGSELIQRLKAIEKNPRLVILASCESGGSATGSALAAIGPRLAEAGIPAVLAMQDEVDMQTVAAFMPVLFRELLRDGQIDRAVAAARAAVSGRPDYWVPTLFMRMKSGRIWYVPGFGDEQEDYEKWESLVGYIQEKTCTPIIGFGMVDVLLGPRRDIAVRWAEKSGFPLAPQDREVLPRVAQYLVTHQSPAYLPTALREAAQDEVLRRYPDVLPPELLSVKAWSTGQLVQALNIAMAHVAATKPGNPFQKLAELRLPIYVTTIPFDFVTDALIAAGAQPEVRICPWNQFVPLDKAIYEDTPTPEKPLVYHLFGHIGLPKSQVYSEDQFFDYLIGVTTIKNLVPPAVRAALANTSLLFLGLQMDDWEFRVFFRYLLTIAGRELLRYYSHVSAQIEPEEDRLIDVGRAQRYLEEYYQSENIGTYWGSSEEFLNDLWKHLR